MMVGDKHKNSKLETTSMTLNPPITYVPLKIQEISSAQSSSQVTTSKVESSCQQHPKIEKQADVH